MGRHEQLRYTEAWATSLSSMIVADARPPGSKPLATPFRIMAPYPNPARGGASVAFEMPAASTVSAEVFDLSGHGLRSLVQSARYEPGHQSVWWDGRDEGGATVASGVYLVRLTVSDRALSRRVVILH